jgi:hypothetical protein
VLGAIGYEQNKRRYGLSFMDIVKVHRTACEKKSCFDHPPRRLYLGINKFLVRFGILMCVDLGTGSRFLGGLSAVEFRNNLGVDPVELFFRENAKERPSQIQGLKNRPRLIRS